MAESGARAERIHLGAAREGQGQGQVLRVERIYLGSVKGKVRRTYKQVAGWQGAGGRRQTGSTWEQQGEGEGEL